MKNSESFKSFEERVGGVYENVKVISEVVLDFQVIITNLIPD
jgi:hypothetical protein